MKDKNIDSIVGSDFLKNIFTLLSGASIAQIISLVAIPILTRLYTPEDFGFIAIYLSIVNIIAAISTGKYDLAIMLPTKKKGALAILKGTFRITFLISLLVLIIVVIIKNSNNKASELIQPFYFYFLPFSIFMIGISNIFKEWFTRQKEFKLQAKTTVFKSGTNSIVNISIGTLFSLKSFGLFIGHILGQALQIITYAFRFFKNEKENLKSIDNKYIKTTLKENLNFPYYSAPMAFLNAISKDILLYALNTIHSTTLVGLYANANKVIEYPLNLISSSFISVFYQKINETKQKIRLYLISYFSNLALAIIAMTPIVFWGEEIFAYVLGNEWKLAGAIAKYIAPLTITSFAMRSVSNIFSLTLKNEILLIWQIIYLIIISVIIFASRHAEFELLLIWVSIIGAILYAALAVIGYFILKNKYETKI